MMYYVIIYPATALPSPQRAINRAFISTFANVEMYLGQYMPNHIYQTRPVFDTTHGTSKRLIYIIHEPGHDPATAFYNIGIIRAKIKTIVPNAKIDIVARCG